MSLVVDTGVVVAAANPRDPDHSQTAELLSASTEQRVIPAPVLVEVDHHLRGSSSWFHLLVDIEAGALQIVDLVPDDYERVGELMRTYADMRVGFVDCAVLAVVERYGESKLATLDRRHFAAMRPSHVEALRLLPEG